MLPFVVTDVSTCVRVAGSFAFSATAGCFAFSAASVCFSWATRQVPTSATSPAASPNVSILRFFMFYFLSAFLVVSDVN